MARRGVSLRSEPSLAGAGAVGRRHQLAPKAPQAGGRAAAGGVSLTCHSLCGRLWRHSGVLLVKKQLTVRICCGWSNFHPISNCKKCILNVVLTYRFERKDFVSI